MLPELLPPSKSQQGPNTFGFFQRALVKAVGTLADSVSGIPARRCPSPCPWHCLPIGLRRPGGAGSHARASPTAARIGPACQLRAPVQDSYPASTAARTQPPPRAKRWTAPGQARNSQLTGAVAHTEGSSNAQSISFSWEVRSLAGPPTLYM